MLWREGRGRLTVLERAHNTSVHIHSKCRGNKDGRTKLQQSFFSNSGTKQRELARRNLRVGQHNSVFENFFFSKTFFFASPNKNVGGGGMVSKRVVKWSFAYRGPALWEGYSFIQKTICSPIKE